jgi:hypothetical protein
MEQVSTVVRPSGPDVMVSYSSKDRPQVLQLVQRLRAAGVAVWIDHGGIDGAQRWGEEIVNAIESCKTVLLMVSQSSVQSDNIAKEVALAWESGKHFLPLYLEDAKIPKSMAYQLAGIQHIRLFDGDPDARFLAVLRALTRLDVHISAYSTALVSADAGDKEKAFEWLNRAAEQRSGSLAKLETEPRFAGLKSDPRFAELVSRVKTLTLEPDESVDAPIRLPKIVERPVATGPLPMWKRFLWPDIFNDTSARKAAAQGVWACAFIVAATILASVLTSTAGRIAVVGLGWNEPIVVALIFGPIAFGILKMGRPAAIVGLILCSLGAFGNLGVLRASGAAVDAYNAIPVLYRNQYSYSPYQAYYYAWFSLAISLACVAAFSNATRGTFAFRALVASGRARDKQDAITREEWAAIRQQMSVKVRTVREKAVTQVAAIRPAERVAPPKSKSVIREPEPAVVVPAKVVEMPPPAAVVRMEGTFRSMIGVDGNSILWQRTGVFAVANVVAALLYFAALSATTSLPVVGAYWLLAFWQSAAFSLAAVLAFRFVKNAWAASAAAAVATLVLILPVYGSLPTFALADIVYREQFQQFILVPLVYSFVFLAAESMLVEKLQPLALSLWLGAMSAEIVTPLFAALLRGLGAKEPPDAVLAGGSLVSAICRSLVFMAIFWGGLLVLARNSGVVREVESAPAELAKTVNQ